MLRVSVIDAASAAIEHARRQLFPFRFERWLALGLVAFLDQCGRTGQAARSDWKQDGNLPASLPPELVSAGLAVMAVLALIALAIGVALGAFALWINSRGVFMYADDVSTGRDDVARPWSEHAEAAWSYFKWSCGVTLGTAVVLLACAGAAAGGVLALRSASGAARWPWIALIVAAALGGLLVALAACLLLVALRDFAAPLMLWTGRPCGDALKLVSGLARTWPGAFVLYLLFKIPFGMAMAAGVFVTCCLCCCALVPVVFQTVLQPLFYFERAWGMILLRQMGYGPASPDALPGPLAPAPVIVEP